MGTPKGALVVDGVRLVDRAITALREAGCVEVIAVVRPGVEAEGAVVNPAPERGLRSSLQLAVDAATHDPLVVVLADMPGVDAASIRQVLDGWREGRVALAGYAALTTAEPDEGARRFLRANPNLIDIITVGGIGADLDSPADLSSWQSRR
jgi:nicotine blue oxidoreductase